MGPCGLGDSRVIRCCCAQNTPRGVSMTEHQNIDLEAARDIFPAVKGNLKMWLILVLRYILISVASFFFTAFRAGEAEAHLWEPGTRSPSALLSCSSSSPHLSSSVFYVSFPSSSTQFISGKGHFWVSFGVFINEEGYLPLCTAHVHTSSIPASPARQPLNFLSTDCIACNWCWIYNS